MGLFGPNIDKLKQEKKVPELLKCLDSKNSDIRYRAFIALASDRDMMSKGGDKLRSMTKDSDPRVRTIASLTFAELGDGSVTGNLREIIADGSAKEKVQLLNIIAHLDGKIDENIMHIIAQALIDKKDAVKIEAIKAIGMLKHKHFIHNLVECLHDKQHKIRLQAVKTLGEIGGEEIIDHLLTLLVDNDQEISRAARAILSKMHDDRAVKALQDVHFLQLVKGMNDKEPIRKETTIKIGVGKIRDGLPLLYKASQDTYKDVRLEALKSIAAFKDPSSVAYVLKLLNDKFSDVRSEAVKTLEAIADENAIKGIESALKDQNLHVRDEAKKALSRLKQASIK